MTIAVEPELPPGEASSTYLAPWCQETDLPESKLAGVSDVDRTLCIAAATNLLYVLSGRQFRSGRSVVRPTSINASFGTQSYLYPYSSMSGYGAAWGFAAGWSWTAVGMGWWQNGQDLSEVVLQANVQRIHRVLVDGVDLGGWPPSNPNYQLYDRRRLVRMTDQSGSNTGAWPWNQQLQLPLSEPGTWMIDYEWGKLPPPEGRIACVQLATDLCRSLSGSDEATLPDRAVSIAQQGLNVTIGDSLNYIKEELTGIPYVDLFLQAHNPAKLRRRSVFLAPNSVLGRGIPSYP